ncbi:MAG: ParB/RepB/Spo0J family partition protein [Cyanobacteria bacterium P01_F01_bin.86]
MIQRGANKSVTSMFGGAQAAQLQTQLYQRDEEIVELKQQLELLSQSAGVPGGVQMYPIERFAPLKLPDGLTQPRKYFDPEGMAKLKRSIAKVGVQEPLLVRHGASNTLEVVSGERRWRSGQELQLTELPAIEKNLNDEQALEIALIANLMREDLNPVEETDSIIALIALRLKLNRENLPSVLFKVKNLRTRYQKSNEEIAQALQATAENSEILTAIAIGDIDSILAEFSISLESFVANRLAALQKMPESLLGAIRRGEIGLSKADVIRRADLSLQAQETMLAKVIEEGLTKQDLAAHVQAVRLASTTVRESAQADLRTQLHQRYQSVRQKKVWKKIEGNPKLKKKMQRVNALLDELLNSVIDLEQ